ncbi:alpha/beta hydrolase [Flavivirga sp. 57AJ16]|uniref:alpha/beta hydrolase n=1 Tax=Flavivirga sp. 57AJ16 TaxID=3025307 RepID=UPI002365245E|nr:alpha/beta hydrolase [Flavivirga sp. 57AJ16]MDD7885145.1 alpha/beta hydrolase [Flavivirga sp. 57AJ16]
MKHILLAFHVLFLFCHNWVRAQEPIWLYPQDEILFAKEGSEIPRLTYYLPENKKNDIAVIVCSGGSYVGRANNVEGIPACKELNKMGITAFLLDYRLPNASRMAHKEIVPLSDAQKALEYVRKHSKAYNINPNKVGIMGFSAGGHLVTTVATHFNQTALENPENINLRPDFVVAVYPVVSFADNLTHLESRMHLIGADMTPEKIKEFSNELQVTKDTPPTFIVSAIDDDVVKVENSLYFNAALRQHKVPVELFLYAEGGHGFGVFNKTAKVQWTSPCFNWILSETWYKKK